MITSFGISGFKRFREQDFDFANLTVLTGTNGSGKTSLIQSVLLAKEASGKAPGSTVRLNEPFGMELGRTKDVRNWQADDIIEFRVATSDGTTSVWRLDADTDDALYLTLTDCPLVLDDQIFSGAPRSFCYLTAERLGPRTVNATSPLPPTQLEVGVKGEHCAQMLAMLGSKPLEDEGRRHPDRGDIRSDEEGTDADFLKYEVERWVSEMCRPIVLDSTIRAPLGSSLYFRAPNAVEWASAPNMGFGVSYALPIVVAGLTAAAGGVLIIENPEAHLHPGGQSRMGVFLAWLAGRGLQVIVETHSDHILNGMRRAIGEFGYLAHDRAIAHFFESDNDGKPKVNRLEFTTIGGISHWPRGFFDQFQIDVASLGRIRRRS
ncbi:putative ATPase [Paraburkholderia sp. GAS199]|uniref:AAA family ATPase n=1 Tax=Paraburkholderia sp. GAS199 TaxID=3035126 RepID=UPI003D262F75